MKKPCATCGLPKNASRTKESEFGWRTERDAYYSNCKACVNKRGRIRTNNNNVKERKRLIAIKEREAIESDPYGHLAADIVALAIRDWRAEKSDELLAFFAGRWFEELCDTAGVGAEYVRKHVLSHSYEETQGNKAKQGV